MEKSLSFKFVKEKIVGSEIFEEEDFKRVYDRVWVEWRFFSSEDNIDLFLLIEIEGMKDRVDRMFRKDVFSEDVIIISDILLFIIIFFRVKVFFIEDYVRILYRLFNDMLGNVLIFRNEIFKRFFVDVEGKEILVVLFLI